MSKKLIAKRNNKNNKSTASSHIDELIKLAQEKPNSTISINSLKLATKYSTKYKIPIPREIKRTYCKKCFSIYNSTNSTKRIKKGILTITCKNCNIQKRIKF